MRLVLGSDLHGNLPYVPPCDILVLAGDILPETDQELFIENALRPWLDNVQADEIVATWGNHDHKPFRNSCPVLRWKLLVDQSAVIKGIKFHGTPWCLPVGRWAWQAPEYLLQHIYSLIPDDTEILISHSPPYGYRDVENKNKTRCGSYVLAARMNQLNKLKFLVCGHIHEARGRKDNVINASCVNEGYVLRSNPWTVIDL